MAMNGIDILVQASQWLRPHLYEVGFAMMASLLVLFGDDFFRWVKKRISRFHFVLRVTVFILICAMVLPAITFSGSRYLASWLRHLDNVFLLPGVVLLFVLLGIIAEKRKFL
ncbi:MAG: DUF3392 family protein [Fibrobacteria bacterium]|nr:DUF3392 family protein [Fibrobacteria bacterium]